tara:strand:- start:514 stop:627 length:114 start_codon:yes stop_codon:yes gene_type:complete
VWASGQTADKKVKKNIKRLLTRGDKGGWYGVNRRNKI